MQLLYSIAHRSGANYVIVNVFARAHVNVVPLRTYHPDFVNMLLILIHQARHGSGHLSFQVQENTHLSCVAFANANGGVFGNGGLVYPHFNVTTGHLCSLDGHRNVPSSAPECTPASVTEIQLAM